MPTTPTRKSRGTGTRLSKKIPYVAVGQAFLTRAGQLKNKSSTDGFTALVWGDSNDVCITSCGGNNDWFNTFGAVLDRRLCSVEGLHPIGRPSYQAIWVPPVLGTGTVYSNMPQTNSPFASHSLWTASGFGWIAGPLPSYIGAPNSCYSITTSNSGVRFLRYLLDQRNTSGSPAAWAKNKSKFCVSLWFIARDTDTSLSLTTNTALSYAATPTTTPASDVSGFGTTINVQLRDTGGPTVIDGSTQSVDCRLPTGNAWQTLTGIFSPWNSNLAGPAGNAQQHIEIEVPNNANTMAALGGILLDDGTTGGVRIVDLTYAGCYAGHRCLEDRDNSGNVSLAVANGAFAGIGQRYMPALGSWIGEDWADRIQTFWTRLVDASTGTSRKNTFNAAGITQSTPYSKIDALFINLFTNDYSNSIDNMAKYIARLNEVISRGIARNPNMLFFIALRPVGGDTTVNRDDPYTNGSYTVGGTLKGLRSSWVAAAQNLQATYPGNVAVLDVGALYRSAKATDLARWFALFGTNNGNDIVNFDPLHLKPYVNFAIADTWGQLMDAT